jgi:predicted restriction endonuclease
VASHIKPWSEDGANRLNPRNVIALCALHDRAFDRGLITIREDGAVALTPSAAGSGERTRDTLLGRGRLRSPQEYFPDASFLAWHRVRYHVQG